jgi:hypothetical protein
MEPRQPPHGKLTLLCATQNIKSYVDELGYYFTELNAIIYPSSIHLIPIGTHPWQFPYGGETVYGADNGKDLIIGLTQEQCLSIAHEYYALHPDEYPHAKYH